MSTETTTQSTVDLTTGEAIGGEAVRPFTVEVPDEAIADLRQRLEQTRWPEKETVADESQGVQLETMKELARYWADEYDFSRLEARLNAFPQFLTEIDGVDIHLLHVRSKHEDTLPVVITHGWPGSIIEMLNIIGPLTDPTAKGGDAGDAFHVVVPSMPGYGFSGKPTTTGWGPVYIADVWFKLMERLGYRRFVAQGGDWGAQITVPAAVAKALASNVLGAGTPPSRLSPQEQRAYDRLDFLYTKGLGYGIEMGNPTTDALRAGRFACGAGCVDARPRCLQLSGYR